jgi:hypothetical protein
MYFVLTYSARINARNWIAESSRWCEHERILLYCGAQHYNSESGIVQPSCTR